MQKNVVLTGFMGTGKTTVGRLLAQQLGYEFIDTDEFIVSRDGRSVSDIFRQYGDRAFRSWENLVAQELSERQGLVIAAGGRMMLNPENASLLSHQAHVFFLTAVADEIVTRLTASDEKRPLLDLPDPVAHVQGLIDQQIESYSRYSQVDTDGKTPEQIVADIVNKLTSAQLAAESFERLPVTHPNGQYDVFVGEQLLSRVAELASITGPMAIITDTNVGPLYAAQLPQATAVVTIPAGEQHKTLETVRSIYDQLLSAGLDRKGTIIALGGGVVGDISGFIAATYMRGIPFVQCPTTILSMVDASVGGKTGVDLPQGKNLVGAFKQPLAVIADIDTLKTLPAAELSAGMAEAIKHGLIADPVLFEQLKTIHISQMSNEERQTLLLTAIKVKRDVVQEDPFEQGRRALLNLGHTFGHAIEQVSGYQVAHGEGVAMGLVAAANLSAKLGYCSPSLQYEIELVLAQHQLPTRIPAHLPPSDLYLAMGSDKKKDAGRLRFVLLRGVGDVFVTADVEKTDVLTTLQAVQDA